MANKTSVNLSSVVGSAFRQARTAVSTVASAVTAAAAAARKAAATRGSGGGGGGGGGGAAASGGGAEISEAAVNGDALLQWYDVAFYANASEVRGLEDFTISGSVEIEEKEEDGSKYATAKNSKGFEAELTAYFDKRLGITDVRAEAMRLVDYAAGGQTGYLYARGSKLIPGGLMLTSARTREVRMTPGGTWISCKVTLTLKTADKLEGYVGGGGGSGGGGGGSGRRGGIGSKYSVTVWYSGSSGARQAVIGTSNTSVEEARKNAWSQVPGNALWASEAESQATNQEKVSLAARQQQSAKQQSEETGITLRANQVEMHKNKNKISPTDQ